jgi:hypothetical protein
MPRKEKFPYSHSVHKTRTPHKCEMCGEIIPVGSMASYKNHFTGKRGYIHEPRGCWERKYKREKAEKGESDGD